MNEFGLVYLLSDDARRYHEQLSHEIEKRFRLKGTFQLNAPSHITLKYRFQAQDIKQVEQTIELFCAKQQPTPWRIQGFNFFKNGEKQVIFLDVKASNAMRESHGELLAELMQINWMQWGEYDHNQLHYHVTLANKGLTPQKFDEVWEFVSARPEPRFELVFDNATLLKIENNIHLPYQKFCFRKD